MKEEDKRHFRKREQHLKEGGSRESLRTRKEQVWLSAGSQEDDESGTLSR